MVLVALTGWLERRQRDAVVYLLEEKRLLRRQLGNRRLRLTDDDRRRLAARRVPRRPCGLAGDRHDCDPGYVVTLASSPDCADLCPQNPDGEVCYSRSG